MLRSRLCTQDQFQADMYLEWCRQMQEQPRFHRKLWEFCYICQALWERGILLHGNRGLGFGVGQEPLPALFASYGCHVVGTDLDERSARDAGWAGTNQHMVSTKMMNQRGICQQDAFERLVTGLVVDMNRIPHSLRDFDFVWSSCALEHLGSIDNGLDFIVNSLDCLRPGGVAVHTTEFNVSSNTETLDTGGTVLFRQRDFEDLVDRLTSEGHHIDISYDLGRGPADYYVDVPPYIASMHLKLQLDKYVTTSIGLIIRKGGESYEEEALPQDFSREYAVAPSNESFSAAPMGTDERQAVYIDDHTAIALVLGRFKMFVDTRDLERSPSLLLDGCYDLEATELIHRLVKPGMSVVDVGAGCGYFSLVAADLVGANGNVRSVVRSGEGFRLLSQSAALNGFGDRLRIVTVSVHNDVEAATEERPCPHEKDGNQNSGPSVAHQCLGSTPIEFLRLSCEAHELLQWDELGRVLREHKPVVLVELNDGDLSSQGHGVTDGRLAAISGCGYMALDVKSFLEGDPKPYSAEPMRRHPGIRHLICVPIEN